MPRISYFNLIDLFLNGDIPNKPILQDNNMKLEFDSVGVRHLYSFGKEIAKFNKEFNIVNIFTHKDKRVEKHISWLKLSCKEAGIGFYETQIKEQK